MRAGRAILACKFPQISTFPTKKLLHIFSIIIKDKTKASKTEACLLILFNLDFSISFSIRAIIFLDIFFKAHLPQNISVRRKKTRKSFFQSFPFSFSAHLELQLEDFWVLIHITILFCYVGETSNKSLLLFFVIFHFFKVCF